jgi:hypothetical protein
MDIQAGMGNSTISKGNLVHIVYMSLDAPEGYDHGTAEYVVTYDRNSGMVSEPVLLGISNTSGTPNLHDGPAITIDSQNYLHVIFGAHSRNFKYTKSLAPNSSTSGWTTPIDIGRENATNGWTYVSLLCDKNDTLHVIGRNDTYGYRFGLWYIRKTANDDWEDMGPLVMPFRSYYSNWYHRLSLDHQKRLFLNYIYYGDQYDRGSEYTYEIDAYKAKWPWESPYLIENDEQATSWGGTQGHDPCIIMSDDGGSSWRIALSSSLELFFNKHFDNGLDGWTLTNDSNTNPIQAMSSYTYNNKTILPRTEETFAVSEQSNYWKKATRTIYPAQPGILTGYMNMVENTGVGMITISTGNHEFIIMADSVAGKVSYRIDSAETATDIAVTTQTWHEVKFIVRSSGVDGYWDGTHLFHSNQGTAIESMSFGSSWTTAPCGYDDFSFVPVAAVLSVTPATQNVAQEAGRTTFTVSNNETTSMPWTAEVTSGSSWLSIASGSNGTDNGSIVVSFTANTTPQTSRTATLKITAAGADGSPQMVTVVQSAPDLIPGDANKDGKVDVGDLGILAANYGKTSGATWATGDFNNDGVVDVGDLGILAANYGSNSSGADFVADYAKVFNTEDDSDSTTTDGINDTQTNSSIFCSELGGSLIIILCLAGLTMMKHEE